MSYLDERIQSFQKECVKLQSSLNVLHSELIASKVSNVELGYIADCCDFIDEIFDSVSKSNISEYENELIQLEKELQESYGERLVGTIYSVPKERVSSTVVRRSGNTKKGKGDRHNLFAAGVLSGVIISGLISYALFKDKDNNILTRASGTELTTSTETNIPEQSGELATIVTEVVTPTPVPTPIVTPVPTIEPTVVATPEPTIEVAPVVTLALGEPGTFLDITDDEQVEARAQYIYDNYFAKFYDKLSDSEKAFITVDRIADTIRTVNGRCPIDENGYKFKDANTTDTYSQSFVELYANIPSSDVMGTVELVPAHLFAIDGSEVQEFLKTYDMLYGRIAEGRNTRNSDMYRGAAEILEAKMYYEWHCQGMGGYILFNTETHEIETENNIRFNQSTGNWERLCPEDGQYKVLTNTEVYPVTNPHNIDATYRYLAYMGSMYRFGSYIEEAEHNQMAPICIPLCVDFATKELNTYSIDEVYTGINEGVWNNVIAQHAGMAEQAPGIPFSVGFWQALDNQLEYDYTHSNTLKLN